MSEPAEAKSSARRVVEGVSATVIAALVIAAAGYLFHFFVGRDGDPRPSTSSPSASSTPTTTVEPTDEPTASPSDDGLNPVDAEPTDLAPSAQAIADGPSYLADMDVVYGRHEQFVTKDDLTFVGFRTGTLTSSGRSYDHAIYQKYLSGNNPSYLDYNLSRKYSKLSFTAAISDSAVDSARVRFEIFLDGRRAKQIDIKYGSPRKVSVETGGVLRLRLYLVRLDGGDLYADAGFGDAIMRS